MVFRTPCHAAVMDLNDTLVNGLRQSLDAMAAGDLRAKGRIIELCSDRMRLWVQRMLRRFPKVGRWEEDGDVFQEAMIKFLQAMDQITFDSPRHVMAVAITQVKRVLIDMARHHGGPMAAAANHASVAGDQHDPVAGAVDVQAPLERWTALHEAIERLPEPQREVFQLVWYMGADQKTVAQLIGRSGRTVKRYWREAREHIRRELGDEPPDVTPPA